MSEDSPPLETDASADAQRLPSAGMAAPDVLPLPLPVDWLDPNAAKVLRRLKYCGFDAFLVGGCVRDLMVGRFPKDFDIATSALPREVKRTFSNCRLIGRRFRLAHIIFQETLIEVATFRRDPGAADPDEGDEERWIDEEAALPAAPSPEEAEAALEPGAAVSPVVGASSAAPDPVPAPGEPDALEGDDGGDAGPEAALERDLLIRSDNVFGTPEEDARRRDFTINGLFYDLATESLLDWVGGLKDIDARVIRTIGTPEIRFREDPVRMLRAIKFAAVLRFTIEPRTWLALCLVAPDITRAAPARLLEEIMRMMRGAASVPCFRLMSLGGILERVLPELAPLVALEMSAEEAGLLTDSGPLEGAVAPGLLRPAAGGIETDASEAADALPPDDQDPSTGAITVRLPGVLGYLRVLDRLDQVGHPLPNHLLVAILCLEPVLRMVKLDDELSASEQVFRKSGFLLDELGQRLRVARRDRERARLVLLGMVKLLWRSSRGGSLQVLSRKSYFPESLLLYALHSAALEENLLDLKRLTRRVNLSPEARRFLAILEVPFLMHDRDVPDDSAEDPPATRSEASPRRRRRRGRRGGTAQHALS